MAQICDIHSFYSNNAFCLNDTGVKRIRVARVIDVDFEKLNTSQTQYFNENDKSFVQSIPLKRDRVWATLRPDYENLKRELIGVDGKPYFDLLISEMRFKGFLNTKQLAEIKKISSLVVVTQLLDNTIIIDGIDYDYRDKQIKKTQFIGSYFNGINNSSSVFDDDISQYTKINITGRQSDKGFKGLFTWDSMTKYSEGIYVADNLFAFMTDDGSLFTFY